MRLSCLLMVIAVGFGLPNFVQAQTSLFSKKTSSLSTADQVRVKELIEEAKEIIRTAPTEYEYVNRLRLGLLPDAYAFSEAFDCFYAGWPSQLKTVNGRRVCAYPVTLPEGQRTYKHEKCGKTEMACNPLLFGKGLCASTATTSNRQTAFSQCENKFLARGNARYDFLKNMTKEELSDLNQTLQIAKDICIDNKRSNVQFKTGMCSRFVTKLKAVEKKLVDIEFGVSGRKLEKVPEVQGLIEDDGLEVSDGKKQEPTLPNNQPCKDCGENTKKPKDEKRENFQSLVNAKPPRLSDADIEKEYKAIRDRYFQSGDCHHYKILPIDAQKTFLMKQFDNEIDAFNHVKDQVPMTVAAALDSLGRAIGWTAEEKQKWHSSYAAATSPLLKTQFQASIMKELYSRLDKSPLKEELKLRVIATMSKGGIAECNPDDANQFFSLSAFKNAIRSIEARDEKPAKANILTILDRSLPHGSDRMMTIDRNTGKVLYHSDVRFGDADFNMSVVGKEADVCSNKEGSNASPHGLGITGKSETSKSYDGLGTTLRSEAEDGRFLRDRGTDFHMAGSGAFRGYYKDPQDKTDKTPMELMEKAMKSGSTEDMRYYLYRSAVYNANLTNTNGCIGVYSDDLPKVRSLIEEGSYAYFHCPTNFIPAAQRRTTK